MSNEPEDELVPKVLIIDDNDANRDLHVFMLNEAGMETTGASSGGEALETLDKDDSIDVVISDLGMPVLDGLTVAEEIRKNESLHPEKEPVKLAFLTGRDVDDAIERVAEREDVERIFKKTGEDFVENVKEWLDESH